MSLFSVKEAGVLMLGSALALLVANYLWLSPPKPTRPSEISINGVLYQLPREWQIIEVSEGTMTVIDSDGKRWKTPLFDIVEKYD